MLDSRNRSGASDAIVQAETSPTLEERDSLSRRRFLAAAGVSAGTAGMLALGHSGRAEAAACGDACLDVTDFGAAGNGTTDDSSAFQEALDVAAEANGGTILVPGGTYRVDSPLAYAASNLLLEFAPDAIVDFSNADSNELFLLISGSDTESVALASDAAEGQGTLSISQGAESGFNTGDWVKIGSDALHDPDPKNAELGVDVKIGEQARVLSTASGTLTLAWGLAGGTYEVTDSAFVQKIAHSTNIRIRGGTFLGGGASPEHDLFRFLYCRDIEVQGIRVEHFTGRACTVDDSINGTIAGNTFIGGTGPANGFYGVSLVWASQDCTIVGNLFTDFRHAVELGGTTSKAGINRRHIITSNHAVGTTAAAFESHSGCDDITYSHNTALDCHAGISVRGPRFCIQGNIIRRPTAVGIFARNQTTEPTHFTIIGNRISDSGAEGIRVSNDGSSTGGGTNVAGVTVSGNAVERSNEYGIAVGSTDSWTMERVSVSGNVIAEPAPAQHGIYLFKVRHASVSGNTVSAVQPQLSSHGGIRLENVTRSAITGNTLDAVVVQGAGIRMAGTCAYIALVNNQIDGFKRGMYFDDGVTDTVISAHCLAGNTIPFTLGAGYRNVAVSPDQLGLVPSVESVDVDSDITLATFSTAPQIIHRATLTATRTLSLSTVYAYRGAKMHITRIGGGAYDLEIGSGPVITLAEKDWAEVTYDGSAWVATAAGTLT